MGSRRFPPSRARGRPVAHSFRCFPIRKVAGPLRSGDPNDHEERSVIKLRTILAASLALACAVGLALLWNAAATETLREPAAPQACAPASEGSAGHADTEAAHLGCDPHGPVRVTAERQGSTFRIETSATLPYRGELRVTTRLPAGVRWVDATTSWTGEGARTLGFAGDSGGVPGEVEVRMLSRDGETFVDQAPLVFDETAGNRVVEARAIDSERGPLMDIPAATRKGGGR